MLKNREEKPRDNKRIYNTMNIVIEDYNVALNNSILSYLFYFARETEILQVHLLRFNSTS